MPLNYIEKGPGLLEAISAAGHWVGQIDRVYVCSDEAAVQSIIDAYPLSKTIEGKKRQIDEFATKLRIKIAGASSPEQSSWPIKAKEAAAYLVSLNQADAPKLTLEASYRGVPVQEIVNRVQTNATLYLDLEALIAGVAGKHKDILTSMDTETPTPSDFRNVIDYPFESDPLWANL